MKGHEQRKKTADSGTGNPIMAPDLKQQSPSYVRDLSLGMRDAPVKNNRQK